ncbi:MAG: porphobilinogen synthase [Candidatus Omnitrophota bacterium]|nr:porphobilinogen synthase [Candidatus Omnitrophota bacterium]
MNLISGFPVQRPRRLRENPVLRRLVREGDWGPQKLVAPLFVTTKKGKQRISSMPGLHRFGIAAAAAEAKKLEGLGIGGVLLFGIPASKDERGSQAFAAGGVVPQAVQAIKKAAPGLAVITDVCLCEYTSHGHCGILRGRSVDNDATLPVLSEIAVSHARSGADLVAPSAMMDGQVAAIRRGLDKAGFTQVPVMSYSVKFASALYGPFREAVGSSPRFGDRRGYQMDTPNAEEALRETALDIQEGADIVMVKPALTSLDILRTIKRRFHWPAAAYQVSGEYALVKAAAAKGWVDEKRLVLELAAAIRRAGADILITYHAKELAGWLKGKG